jgi:hypothetical protein
MLTFSRFMLSQAAAQWRVISLCTHLLREAPWISLTPVCAVDVHRSPEQHFVLSAEVMVVHMQLAVAPWSGLAAQCINGTRQCHELDRLVQEFVVCW